MRLAVANTRYQKPFERTWTHVRGDVKRQIDYCLAKPSKWCRARDVEAGYDINLGSDHRCLKADLEIQRAPLEKRPKHKASRVLNLVGWKPSKENEFKTFLNGRVASIEAGQLLKSLQERCEEIEDVLLEAAKLNQHAETEINDTSAILEARLHNMIDERKQARVARDKEHEKVVS
jgi:hypothetical protein